MKFPLIVADYFSTVFPLLIWMAVYALLERFDKKHSGYDSIVLHSNGRCLIMVPLLTARLDST